MKILKILILSSLISSCYANINSKNKKYNIGLAIVATGQYINYVEPLIKSGEKFFCTNHEVTYFIFTDSTTFTHKNAIKVYQDKLGWPYDTLMRFEIYFKNKEKFNNIDYIFACDADMLFVDDVSDEILSDLVGTFHPGFYKRTIELPHERNIISKAYISKKEDKHYFAGGFYGGKKEEFFKLTELISKNILFDLMNGYIAIWHDESHLNRYFLNNPPNLSLSPSYCYPEDVEHLSHDDYKSVVNLPKKLVALAKK